MSRGTLRIHLGAAPGVGKTYAMLNEGRRRAGRGHDVVVGFVETHGRVRTAEQVGDLEVVPRKELEYRDAVFEEMDVDAILTRRPEVVLVDELAHTNVPGSRNAKRWQDVEELLAAGIQVISSLNIQHLESLNDVVERITGVVQRETIPDQVVRRADQIELVDMTPEALRRRMAHGNIYTPEKIDAALANYFRPGNLAALRELALLWVADRVDEGLEEYRARHGITKPWEVRERVVVALTGAPGGEALIRRAARMASRTKGELVGVHVRADDGLATLPVGLLEDHRRLLEELGGQYREVTAGDVGTALVQMAKAENATQLVLGASRRSRWAELTRGSVINRVVREAGGALDIHVISTGEEGSGLRRPRGAGGIRLAALPRRRQLTGLVTALAGLPLLTVGLFQVGDSVGLQTALLCYLLLVVAVATIGGAWPAGLASIGGFLLLNWFFAPPVHTFTIANGRDLLALFAFLVVAGVISALVDLVARVGNDAHRARAEAGALARMSALVLREGDPLPALLADLVSTFNLDGAAVLRPGAEGRWQAEAAVGPQPPASPDEACLALDLSDDTRLVLQGRDLRAEHRELLSGFVTQLGVALQKRRLEAQAAGAATVAKANELRMALLAAVSHDLRTPLAAIRAGATSLLADDVTFDRRSTRELLTTIDQEADRLNVLVGNLLDMSRLQTGVLVVQPRPVGLDEVVASVLLRLPSHERVDVGVPETLPRVLADPALLERTVANLVDNALRFSPPNRRVRVEAGAVSGRVHLRIVDQGPGISESERRRAFEPLPGHGDRGNGAGMGLGLAVALGFTEAIGGELTLEDTPGGGCTMVLSLPEAQG